MSSTSGLVTVILPVHNGRTHLTEALHSIVTQTYEDWELLVIDDASTDGSAELAEQFGDARIRVLRPVGLRGLPAMLNHGFAAATGAWIARMDADDVARPERLERQVLFLQGHPEIGVCGTWARLIGAQKGVREHPEKAEEIRALLLFRCALIHSSVMFRGDLVRKQNIRYDENYLRSQDYELWSRLAETTALANLPEYLLDYRLHETQAGRQHSEDQKAYACRVQQRLLENLGLKPTAEELALHEEIAEEKVQAGQAYFARALDWLRVLQKQNDRLGLYPRDTFALLLAQRWKALYIKAGEIGLWPGWNFIFSSRAKMAGISLAQRRKYCLKQWKKTVACAS